MTSEKNADDITPDAAADLSPELSEAETPAPADETIDAPAEDVQVDGDIPETEAEAAEEVAPASEIDAAPEGVAEDIDDAALPADLQPVVDAAPEAEPVDDATLPVAAAVATDVDETALLPTLSDDSATAAIAAGAGVATATTAAATDATTALPDAAIAGATAVASAPPVQPQWSEAAPKRRKRRWPWLLVPAAVIAGATVVSTLLIAPGVQAAGVSVGGLTRDAAEKAIAERLSATSLSFQTASGPVSVSAADLGATVDATKLAATAHGDYPLWNVTSWDGKEIEAPITLDDAKATAAMQKALPGAFVAPVEATVSFDGNNFVVTDSADGSGIPVEEAREALQKAFNDGSAKAELSGEPTVVPATLTTDEAKLAADKLNGIVSTAGFYVGEERTVPVDAKTAVSWIDYTVGDDGSVEITADESAIAPIIPTLAEKVDRPAVDGTTYVDTSGNPLEPYELWGGDLIGAGITPVDGYVLEDTSGVAAAFAKQLATGNAKYVLPVKIDKAENTNIERRIEVNLSEQRVYVHEGGKVIRSMLVSTGRATPETETHTGYFRTGWRTPSQDLGCVDGYDWCTEDVPHVMYFNGDEAFHGTYWHNNFGTRMSHGCVNMTQADAEWLYYWAPAGTEVWVHN